MIKQEPRWNIYIQQIGTQKVIGQMVSNISDNRLERMLMAGLSRIDTDNYCLAEYEVGSAEDLKASASIE